MPHIVLGHNQQSKVIQVDQSHNMETGIEQIVEPIMIWMTFTLLF